nr:hypothetical protein [Actinomycetota bacterium]
MTRPWVVTLFWSALLAVHWVVMWAAFNADLLPAALLGGSALIVALGGAHLAWLSRRDRHRRGELIVEAVPDLSLATVLVGVSVSALPLGAFLGPWISLIAAGALLFGVAGVLNERRASQRAAAAVAGGERAPGGGEAVGPQG